MWPRLTRRRVAGACSLGLSALFVGSGVWHKSVPLSVFGLAIMILTSLGIGYLLIQRVNRVVQLSDGNRCSLESLETSQRKSIWLQRKCIEQISDLSTRVKAFREIFEAGSQQQSKKLEQLLSTAAERPDEYYEQLCAFRGQFGQFVAAVSEWIALAEVGLKQNVAELQSGRVAAIEVAVDRVMRRLDGVDHVLANVRDAAEQMPRVVADNSEHIRSMSGAFDAAIKKMLDEARGPEHAAMLESVQRQLDCLSETAVATQQTSMELNEIATADSKQLKEISKAVTLILPSQRTEIARAKIESVQEVEAVMQLQAFLAPDKPMPLLGGWAMEPVSMLGVVNELLARKPGLVLECGSGTSTLWIARTLKRLGKGRIVSLEHLREHYNATSRAVDSAGLDSYVELCLAPLRSHCIGKEQFKWYDLRGVKLRERSVDLLLIDGPPQKTGLLARYPALPLLERMLADQALIILDDATRPDKMEETNRWLKEFPGLRESAKLGERTTTFVYAPSKTSKRRESTHLQAL